MSRRSCAPHISCSRSEDLTGVFLGLVAKMPWKSRYFDMWQKKPRDQACETIQTYILSIYATYLHTYLWFVYTGSGDIDHMMLLLIYGPQHISSPLAITSGSGFSKVSFWECQAEQSEHSRDWMKYLLIAEIPHKFGRQVVCPITIQFWDYTVLCGAGFCPRTGREEFIRWTCNSRGWTWC